MQRAELETPPGQWKEVARGLEIPAGFRYPRVFESPWFAAPGGAEEQELYDGGEDAQSDES